MTTVFIRVRLNLLAGRVAAVIDPADTLGALLVLWLLLSALIANNALVRFTGARRMRFWHAALQAAPLTPIPGVFRVICTRLMLVAGGRSLRMTQLFLALPDQQLIAEHLPDDLLGLSLGFLPDVTHESLLSGKNGPEAAMFPLQQIKDRRFLAGSLLLVTVPEQCNNSVADQN
jgi:hypothetical protein